MNNRGIQIKKDFAAKLKALRETKGLSIREFANTADIDHSQIVRMENGETSPSIVTLGKIADALGISISKLTEGI